MQNEVGFEVKGKDGGSKKVLRDTEDGVKDITKAVNALPKNQVVKVELKDQATAGIKKIDAEKVADKNVTVKADTSKAQADVKSIKADPIEVPVKANAGNMKAAGRQGGEEYGSGMMAGLASIPVAGTLTGIFADAMDKVKSSNALKVDLENQMGLSPQEAKALGTRIGDQYASGLGDSKEQIGAVYSALSSDVKGWSNLTTGEQDRIAKNMTKITQGLKVDVTGGIQAASSAVTNKLVPSWLDAQDLITKGYQTLGSRGDDWTDTLQEYSGYFEKMGFTASSVLGIMQQGLQAGARDTDYLADAWKEFGIRVIDGSKSTEDALKSIGLNAKKIPEAISKGGPEAQKAIETIITKLQGIKNPVDQNKIGVALFGTQWEDTFRRVIMSTDLAAAKMTEFKGATESMATATETEMDKMSRRWDRGVEKFGEGAAKVINDGVGLIDNAIAQADSYGNVAGALGKITDRIDAANNGTDFFSKTMNGATLAAIELAVASGQAVPASMRNLISAMSDADLKAQGASRSIDGAGNAVYRLPGGKEMTVSALDDATWRAQRIQHELDRLRDKTITITTRTIFHEIYEQSRPGGQPFSQGRHAAGGPATGSAATGGARTGVIEVNERGLQESAILPDRTRVTLPMGSQVNPNAGNRDLNAGTQPVIVDLRISGDGPLTRAIAHALKESVRKSGKGGSSQSFFGRS